MAKKNEVHRLLIRDTGTLRAYQLEVWHQADCVLLAAEALEQRLAEWKSGGSGRPALDAVNPVFREIQSLLTAAANLSKLLWGEPRRGAREAFEFELQPLRTDFAVPNYSPLRSRKLRNYFDHYARELAEWARLDLPTGHTFTGPQIGKLEDSDFGYAGEGEDGALPVGVDGSGGRFL